MTDIRERPDLPSGWKADHEKLVLIDPEGTEHACHYAVCPVCEGKGTHVNPSIDSQGISPDEFDSDPDFEEAYHRGDYDIRCNGCKGRRVILVPKETSSQRELTEAWDYEIAADAERMAEIRMGA